MKRAAIALGVTLAIAAASGVTYLVWKSADAAREREVTLDRAAAMLTATQAYAKDHGGRTPDVRSREAFVLTIAPYLKHSDLRLSRNPIDPVLDVSPSLFGSTLKDGEGLAFYDHSPWPNGVRCAVTLDGHRLTLDESEFARRR